MAWHSLLSDPALGDFVAIEQPAFRALIRRGYEGEVGALCGQESQTGESVVGGRAPHPLVTLGGGDRVVVRAYRRGGFVRHLNRARYFLGHRSFEELRITERARARGVQAPEVIAAAERRERLGYTAMIATRWIAGGVDLAAWLDNAPPADVPSVLREVGRQIARMHEAGIDHLDLNLRNVLIVSHAHSEAAVFLLDFDRARLHDKPLSVRPRSSNLNRFMRSARKLGSKLNAAELEALEAGYGKSWPHNLQGR